jgi:hypothetical protein
VAGTVAILAVVAAVVVLGFGDGDGGGPRSRKGTSSERMIERARSEEDPDDIDVPEPERPGDLGNDSLLDRLAEECFDGDPSSCDELFRDSPPGSDYEKYGSTCGERTTGGQRGGCGALYPDPDYAELRRECAGGDDGACDTLYNFAPRESVDEHFGSTCGGRSEEQLFGGCVAEDP